MIGTQEITLETGQVIPWPRASGGIAQIEELLRSNVVIIYTTSTGRLRRPKISAEHAAALIEADKLAGGDQHTPLLPIRNPMCRAAVPKTKTFKPGDR